MVIDIKNSQIWIIELSWIIIHIKLHYTLSVFWKSKKQIILIRITLFFLSIPVYSNKFNPTNIIRIVFGKFVILLHIRHFKHEFSDILILTWFKNAHDLIRSHNFYVLIFNNMIIICIPITHSSRSVCEVRFMGEYEWEL
mgnify:CR=1 FL=1